ncbi:MAG: amidohydrolase family protein [Verrucomicrobiota bacterium]
MLILWFIGLLALLTALRLILFRGPMRTPVEPPPTGILDMHCHTAGIGAGDSGAWISDELRNSWKFGLYLKLFGSDETTLNKCGDTLLVDIIARSLHESKYVKDAVILALDAPYTEEGELDRTAGEVCVPNRLVATAVKPYPKLHFGASVHPNRKDALEELAWSKQRDAVFIKWLPNIQNIDPANKRYRPYYAKMVNLDLPLLTHVGDEDSFSQTNNALGDPRRLKLPLECGVRVIAAHVASSGENEGQCNVERLIEMMPEYPNLVADISTLTQANRRKHFPTVLNDARLEGRLLYGTDYPLTQTPLVSPLLYPLNLTLAQLWDIFRTRNSWDRDVKLKAALGTPPEVFNKSREYLGIH